MAKSSRASRTKKNNVALKKKVFGPVEEARAARLNERLLAIASKTTASSLSADKSNQKQGDGDMEIDEEAGAAKDMGQDEMIVDGDAQAPVEQLSKTKQKAQARSKSHIYKKRRGKPRNQITFPAKGTRRRATGS